MDLRLDMSQPNIALLLPTTANALRGMLVFEAPATVTLQPTDVRVLSKILPKARSLGRLRPASGQTISIARSDSTISIRVDGEVLHEATVLELLAGLKRRN